MAVGAGGLTARLCVVEYKNSNCEHLFPFGSKHAAAFLCRKDKNTSDGTVDYKEKIPRVKMDSQPLHLFAATSASLCIYCPLRWGCSIGNAAVPCRMQQPTQ